MVMSSIRTVAYRVMHEKPAHWRKGQAVFNAVEFYFPTIAEMLRGSDFDCFYDDSKIEGFIAECERRFEVRFNSIFVRNSSDDEESVR